MEIFVMSAAGIYDWPIIKQVSWLLGQVMNGIYNALSAIGIENIGVAIIVFTIIVYTLLLPLTIKQQKFTKMSAVMQPEIQKIQKRYANKKDQASMLKQQEEMNMVYDKYGLKMSSGCSFIIAARIPVRTLSGSTKYSGICYKSKKRIYTSC